MKIGNRIEQARRRKNWTQGDLAEAIGFGPGQQSRVSRWERDGGMPTIEQIVAISDATGASLDFLLRGDESVPQPVAAPEITPDERNILEIVRALDVPKNAAIQALAFIARERAGMDKDAPLTLLPPGSSGRIVGGVRDVTDREKSRDETPKRSGRREGDTIKSGTPDKP